MSTDTSSMRPNDPPCATRSNAISPIVYVLIGLLGWGLWTQREEVSRLRNQVQSLAYEKHAQSAERMRQQSYETEVVRLKAEESKKESRLVQVLTQLNSNDLEELKQLHREQTDSIELVNFVASRGGGHKSTAVTPEWMHEFVSKDAFSRVTEVTLRITEPVSELAQISRYPTIRALSVGHGPITPEAISHLKQLPHLESLHLEGTDLSDSSLVALSELTSLEKLTIHGSIVTDVGMMNLAQLRRLKELRIDGSKAITDQGISFLARMTELRTLDLHGAKITGSGFAHLANLPLEKLWLHGTLVDNEGLTQVVKLTTLQHLRVDNSKIDDGGLQHLKNLPNLRSLRTGQGTSVAANRRLGEMLPKVHIER